MLLANNADVNAKDDSEMTPLQLALQQGRDDIADLLRQHGARE